MLATVPGYGTHQSSPLPRNDIGNDLGRGDRVFGNLDEGPDQGLTYVRSVDRRVIG